MKKAIVLIALIPVFCLILTPVNAAEITADSDTAEDVFNEENYIPQYVLDIINENGSDTEKYSDISALFSFCVSVLKESVSAYTQSFSQIFVIIFVIAIFRKINDNQSFLMIANLVFTAVIAKEFIFILSELFEQSESVLETDKQIITVTLPSVVTILMMGGGAVSASGSAVSFAGVMSVLDLAVSDVVGVMLTVAAVLLIFEKLSPAFSELNSSRFIKKYTVITFSFITSLMLTVMTYQNVLNARADSLTSRTVKFAASNFIPIVGNAVGESYKTVSAGISYLKTSLGGITSAAIFFTFFPIIANIVIIKIFFSFSGFVFSLCGFAEEKNFFEGITNILDILLSVIICSAILSFMLMFLFAIIAFGY